MKIWLKSPDSTQLNKVIANTLASHLGIKVTYVGEDFVVATMPVNSTTMEGAGLLHGGASLALAETIGTIGADACVDLSKYRCLCMEINANHIASVKSGKVTAMARPVHQGTRSQVWRVEIRNDEDDLVCESRLTLSVVPVAES